MGPTPAPRRRPPGQVRPRVGLPRCPRRTPVSSTPTAPKHLSRRSKAFWRRVLTEYVLEVHHVELLLRACEAMDRADEARKQLDAEGLTVVDRYGQVKPHPCASIETGPPP